MSRSLRSVRLALPPARRFLQRFLLALPPGSLRSLKSDRLLAAEVCTRGARFFNLSLDVPPEARGRDLSADDMERFGVRLEEYDVRKLAG
jgi:hypothetical protein